LWKLNPDHMHAGCYPQFRWLQESPRIHTPEPKPQKWLGYVRVRLERWFDPGKLFIA